MREYRKFYINGQWVEPAEENPYEANLGFTVKLNKQYDFIGKAKLQKVKDTPKKQFVMLTLVDSKPGEPLLLHDEPIYCENKIVGETTSGNYSFNYKKNMSLGYINLPNTKKELKIKKFQIEVAKIKYNASIQIKPLHDPDNISIKT